MIKFVHFSDNHLDSAFSGLSRNHADLRRSEQRMVFSSAIERAKEIGADIVFIAGDVFDSQYVSKETVLAVKKAFAGAEKIKFVVTPGNHDPYMYPCPWYSEEFPENVFIFKSNEIEKFEFPELCLEVYGCAFSEKPPLIDFVKEKHAKYSVGVFHGDFNSGKNSAYAPITKEEIINSGFDYLALGHAHAYASGKLGETTVAYSGCPEGRGFDECDEKYIILGEINENGVNLQKESIQNRKLYRLKIDLGGVSLSEEAAGLCRAAAEKIGATPRDLLSFVLAGTLQREANIEIKTLKLSFDGYFYAEVKDETIPEFSADDFAQDSLMGLIVKNGAVFADAYPEKKDKVLRAMKMCRDALSWR